MVRFMVAVSCYVALGLLLLWWDFYAGGLAKHGGPSDEFEGESGVKLLARIQASCAHDSSQDTARESTTDSDPVELRVSSESEEGHERVSDVSRFSDSFARM